MKTRWILCVAATVIALAAAPSLATTFQDGAYHLLDGSYSTVAVYNNFWNEPTTVELVSGGYINGNLNGYENSNIIVSGGLIRYNLYANDDSNVTISGGTVGQYLRAYENSNVTISGGTIAGDLCAYTNVSISGGSIGDDLYADSNSNVSISGGTVGGNLLIYSTLTVDGQDFAIDGYSLPYGGTFDSGGQYSRTGFLTSTLANGDLMANTFTIYSGGSLVLIPEPATLGLLGLGGLALLRRKRGYGGAEFLMSLKAQSFYAP